MIFCSLIGQNADHRWMERDPLECSS